MRLLATGTLGKRDGDGEHSPFALALFEGLDGLADLMPRDPALLPDAVHAATSLLARTLEAQRGKLPVQPV